MIRWIGEYSRPKISAKPPSPRSKGMPNRVGRGMPEMPSGPLVRIVPVDDHDPDDLAEGERDDGEIVAAQAQHRETEDQPPAGGQHPGHRQADPEAEIEIGREQSERIGADRIEGDVAEVEEAGEADDDIQPPAEHAVGEDDDRLVHPVAVGEGQETASRW